MLTEIIYRSCVTQTKTIAEWRHKFEELQREKQESDGSVQKLQKRLEEERERYTLLSSQFSELNSKMVEIINNVNNLRREEMEYVSACLGCNTTESGCSHVLFFVVVVVAGEECQTNANEAQSFQHNALCCGLFWFWLTSQGSHVGAQTETRPRVRN